jgi:hypothetical protein
MTCDPPHRAWGATGDLPVAFWDEKLSPSQLTQLSPDATLPG